MKKILVTGGTGFIGSHLCELLVRKGYEVTAFDRYNINYNLGNLENSDYKKHIKFIFGDIRDFDSVEKAAKKADIIMHLAALIGIPYSYNSPLAYIKTNIEGTYNILEAAKKLKTNQVIVTSTSEVYGTAQQVTMNEKHPLVGQSPYAASKIAADQLAISYFRSFKLPVKIIRPFNTFGPRQSSRAIIPTVILQALNNKNIKLGNLRPTRDFLYVEDTVNAYLEIMKCKKLIGEVVNVGTGREISIKKIVELIKKFSYSNPKILVDESRVRKDSSEVLRLRCDSSLLKRMTNWKVSKKFEDGLKETIKWFKKNNQKKLSKLYNI